MSEFVAGLLAGIAILGLLAAAAWGLWRWKTGGVSARVRLLTRQYQTMTHSAGQEVPAEMLSSPELIASRMEFRKIEAIEQELINENDQDVAKKLLLSFLRVEDPWVRARAAKAMVRLDKLAAFTELESMVRSSSPFIQLAGIWALGEMATAQSLVLLMPLVWSKNKDVQQSAIRSLVQMDTRRQIPDEYQTDVKNLLKEVRYKTDWIL